MTATWVLAIALQYLLAGVALWAGVMLLLRAATGGRLRNELFGWWAVVLGLALAANAVVLSLPEEALEVALFVRTVLIATSVVLLLPVLGRAAGRSVPRWLFATVTAIFVLRLVLWVATDTVFAHELDGDGMPRYGALLLPTTLPIAALVGWWLGHVARRSRHDEELRPISFGVAAGIVLALASLFVPDPRTAEYLTGVWLIPIAGSMQVVATQRDRAAERERQDLSRERIALLEELEHVNARLRDALRIREDILAVTTHELKTPLTPLIGMLELLAARHEQMDAEMMRQQLEVAVRNARRLDGLVDDLLNASRLRGQHDTGVPGQVTLAPVLHEVATMYSALTGVVTVDADPEATAWIDPGHLAQVVTNLVSNAAKYGGPPYRLSASVVDDDTVVLAVTDHGAGVPEDFVEELFEPFARADREADRDTSGIGLGLSIACALVGAAGGRLQHEHVTPSGASFVVELPSRPNPRRVRLVDPDLEEGPARSATGRPLS